MENQDRIKLIYTVYTSGGEELISTYFNDIQRHEFSTCGGKGKIPPSKPDKEPRITPPDSFSGPDRILLEKRPPFAQLSIGSFKLESNVLKSGYIGKRCERCITYARVE